MWIEQYSYILLTCLRKTLFRGMNFAYKKSKTKGNKQTKSPFVLLVYLILVSQSQEQWTQTVWSCCRTSISSSEPEWQLKNWDRVPHITSGHEFIYSVISAPHPIAANRHLDYPEVRWNTLRNSSFPPCASNQSWWQKVKEIHCQ